MASVVGEFSVEGMWRGVVVTVIVVVVGIRVGALIAGQRTPIGVGGYGGEGAIEIHGETIRRGSVSQSQRGAESGSESGRA